MQKDNGKYQDQVKELIRATADSLDNLALKMLFVSVQQNNLGLCMKYVVDLYAFLIRSINSLLTPILVHCHSKVILEWSVLL